ncbi:MAG: SDR family NAD(P)-dependent oxidoreductase [Gemmataceae bacterium]
MNPRLVVRGQLRPNLHFLDPIHAPHQKSLSSPAAPPASVAPVAVKFAQAGLAVAVNYSRSEEDARQTVAEVERHGRRRLLCQANVAEEAAVRDMVRRCKEELGGLDILVNNAAMTHFIDHRDLAGAAAVWDEIFGVNVKGLFFCCKEAMPLLEERSGIVQRLVGGRLAGGWHWSRTPRARRR